MTVACALFKFMFLLHESPEVDNSGFPRSPCSQSPGIQAVSSFPLVHPGGQPQPPGVDGASVIKTTFPAGDGGRYLSRVSRKFPTSCRFHSCPTGQGGATWPQTAQGGLGIVLCCKPPRAPLLRGAPGCAFRGQTSLCHNDQDFSARFSLFCLHQGPCFTAVFASRNGLSGLGCGLQYYSQ